MKAIRTTNAEDKLEMRTAQFSPRLPMQAPHYNKCSASFCRTIKGRQPHVGQTIDIQATYDQALTKDAKAKEKIKTCADARGHAQPSSIQVGDKVLEKETRAKNYPKTKNYPQMSTSSFDASLM